MAYNISYNLKNHIDRVHKKLKPFSCEICGDCFTSKLGMQQHVKSIHQGIKEYVCHICAKAYSQKTGLTQHMLYTHEKEKSVKYKKFQCTICDYVSTCDYTLNHHIKTVHHKIKEHCCDKVREKHCILEQKYCTLISHFLPTTVRYISLLFKDKCIKIFFIFFVVWKKFFFSTKS